MKTRITKIFVLALSLALLVGVAMSLSVSAENESLEIVSQNVSYEGKTHLYFAVNYENVTNPEAIKLVVTYTDDEGATQTVTVTDSEALTLKDSANNDVFCRAFRTPGVDAKNFTKEFTVKAILEDVESAEKTYSVAEYCHQWLAYIAGIAEPSAKELKVKAACEATLLYGTKIQALLDYYPDGNTSDYPENYSYIIVDGGTANGQNKLFIRNGETVTLSAATTPAAWSLKAVDGTVNQITQNSFTASGSCYVTPVNGKFFSDTSYVGTRLNFDDGTIGSTILEGGNNVYTTTTVVDGKLDFERIPSTEGEGYLRWNVGSSTHKIFVFETDVHFSGFTVGSSVGKIRLQLAGIDEQITINHSGSDISIVLASGTGKVTIKEGEWCNLRFEIDTTKRTFNVFVNNTYAGTLVSTSTTTSSSTRVLFYLLKVGYGGEILFDNIYHGFVEEGTAIPAN